MISHLPTNDKHFQHGFKFHHAKEDYVMMYNWLPTNEVCNIPHYAHTMIGVGAVVINDANQILVVSEKYFVGDKPLWKLPGGYVEPGNTNFLLSTSLQFSASFR